MADNSKVARSFSTSRRFAFPRFTIWKRPLFLSRSHLQLPGPFEFPDGFRDAYICQNVVVR